VAVAKVAKFANGSHTYIFILHKNANNSDSYNVYLSFIINFSEIAKKVWQLWQPMPRNIDKKINRQK